MNVARFGIITEDKTDADAVGILIRRIVRAANAPPPGIKPYWANGCARLRQKVKSKMVEMMSRGCQAVVIVHDLERKPENQQLNDQLARHPEPERKSVGLRALPLQVQTLAAGGGGEGRVGRGGALWPGGATRPTRPGDLMPHDDIRIGSASLPAPARRGEGTIAF